MHHRHACFLYIGPKLGCSGQGSAATLAPAQFLLMGSAFCGHGGWSCAPLSTTWSFPCSNEIGFRVCFDSVAVLLFCYNLRKGLYTTIEHVSKMSSIIFFMSNQSRIESQHDEQDCSYFFALASWIIWDSLDLHKKSNPTTPPPRGSLSK